MGVDEYGKRGRERKGVIINGTDPAEIAIPAVTYIYKLVIGPGL